MIFDLSAITTGNTRTFAFPDFDVPASFFSSNQWNNVTFQQFSTNSQTYVQVLLFIADRVLTQFQVNLDNQTATSIEARLVNFSVPGSQVIGDVTTTVGTVNIPINNPNSIDALIAVQIKRTGGSGNPSVFINAGRYR